LHVSTLKVYNFRNLTDQKIDLGSGPVYISGLNGNGKTNLVEAIYLLSGSRSFRTNASSELLKRGAQECSIFGTVTTVHGTEELGLLFTPGERRAVSNGKDLESMTDLIGRLRVIAFSPADLSLVKGAPSGRRRFLDRHMVDLNPPFIKVLMGYQRALASKSAVLKQPGCTYAHLKPWNELLTQACGKIVDNRVKFLDSLADKSHSFHALYAPTDGELSVTLESDFYADGKVFSQEEILAKLENAAPREMSMRSVTLGAQRDDVKITLGGVDARAYASQGQTRSVVLSMKVGVIEMVEHATGESPVIILDDVDSELDKARSERLFSALLSKPRQIIVTGTEAPSPQLIHNPELTTLTVTLGVITSGM
jgi:DNA replication and repair protein RecF